MKNHIIRTPKNPKELQKCLEDALGVEGKFILDLTEWDDKKNLPVMDIFKTHQQIKDRFYVIVDRNSRLEEELEKESLLGILNVFNHKQHIAKLIDHSVPFYEKRQVGKNRCVVSLFGTLQSGNSAELFFSIIEELADVIFLNLNHCYAWDEVYASEFRASKGRKKIYLIREKSEDNDLTFKLPNEIFYAKHEDAAALEDLIQGEKYEVKVKRDTIIIRGYIPKKQILENLVKLLQSALERVDPYDKKNLIIDIRELYQVHRKAESILVKALRTIKNKRPKAYILATLPRGGYLSKAIYKLYRRNFLVIPSLEDVGTLDRVMSPNFEIDKSQKHPTLKIHGNFFHESYFKKAMDMLRSRPLSNLSHQKKESEILFFDLTSLPCPSYEIIKYIIQQSSKREFRKVILANNHVKELFIHVLYEKIKDGMKAVLQVYRQEITSEEKSLCKRFVPKILHFLRDPKLRESYEEEIESVRSLLVKLKEKPSEDLMKDTLSQTHKALACIYLYSDKMEALRRHQRRVLFISDVEQRQLIQAIQTETRDLFPSNFGNMELMLEEIHDIHIAPTKLNEDEGFDLIVYNEDNLTDKISKMFTNYRNRGNKVLGIMKRKPWLELTPFQIEQDCHPRCIARKILEMLQDTKTAEVLEDEYRYLFSGNEADHLDTLIQRKAKRTFVGAEETQFVKDFLQIRSGNYYEAVVSQNSTDRTRSKMEFMEWRDWGKLCTLNFPSKSIEVLQSGNTLNDLNRNLQMILDYTGPEHSSAIQDFLKKSTKSKRKFYAYLMGKNNAMMVALKSSHFQIHSLVLSVKTSTGVLFNTQMKYVLKNLADQLQKDIFLDRIAKNFLETIHFVYERINRVKKSDSNFWITTFVQLGFFHCLPTFRIVFPPSELEIGMEKEIEEFGRRQGIILAIHPESDTIQVQLSLVPVEESVHRH